MTDAQIRSTIIIVGTVLFIVVLMILLRTVRTKEHNQHLHVQKKLRESQQRELEGYETSIQNLIAEIANKPYDAEAALALSEQCQDYIGIKLTGQPIVDALLAYKRKICADKNIVFRINAINFPVDFLLDDEYVGIFGNLLDNAIEAAERTLSPWICLNSFSASGQWVLEVTNSKSANEAPLERNMETIKEDKKNHGLGGKIVKRIVKKYRGVVNYRDYGDSFEVMTAIPIAETEGRKTGNVECGDLR